MKNELGKEFYSYARGHHNISSLSLHRFHSYITPNIIEERQLNIAMMSVFDIVVNGDINMCLSEDAEV